MVARRDVRDLLADGLDDARRLVSEHRGKGARVQALHEVEVGVAQTRGDGAHEHFVRTDRAELDVVDDELTG